MTALDRIVFALLAAATAAVVIWLLWPIVARAEAPRGPVLEIAHRCGPAAAIEARLAELGMSRAERSEADADGDWVERWTHPAGVWVLHLRMPGKGLICFIYEGRGWHAGERF